MTGPGQAKSTTYVVKCGAGLFLGIETQPRAASIERARRFATQNEAEAAAEALRKRGSSTYILPWQVCAIGANGEVQPA